MSLQSAYVKTIARQLRYHAVWHPGDPIHVGDYGSLSSGVFRKLGSLADFDIPFDLESTPLTFWEYASDGVRTNRVAGSAMVPAVGPLPAGVISGNAALQITFGSAYSLFIRANRCRWSQMKNVRQVALAAKSRPDWDYSWRIASGLRQADALIVLMNEHTGASISLHGDAKTIASVEDGSLNSDVSFEVSGDAALKYIGRRGPFLMELIKVRRLDLFGPIKHAHGGALPSPVDDPYDVSDPIVDVGDAEP